MTNKEKLTQASNLIAEVLDSIDHRIEPIVCLCRGLLVAGFSSLREVLKYDINSKGIQ